jgi:hypothetical protein
MSESVVEAPGLAGPTPAQLQTMKEWLGLASPATDDAGRIDRIRALDELKNAICAAEAIETVRFKASQLAAQQAAGVSKRRLGDGITEQVGLARRESPGRATRLVSLAETLTLDMPETLTAMTLGELSEWRALKIATETAFLSPEDRRRVDAELAGTFADLSDREAVATTRRLAYALDPQGFVSRGKKAHKDRHVSLRPVPDTMARFGALLPVAQGVAVLAALSREADARRAAGDPRTRGQVMADTLVERVTGQSQADQVPVEVQLVMSDATLFGFEDRPASFAGYGPIPGAQAREWLLGLDDDTRSWIRRLYVDETDGALTALDTHRRVFRDTLRRALLIRDQWCRTPWCGAPIRHLDHPVPAAEGGVTSAANGQGLCERCNYTKESPGWRACPDPGGGAGVAVTLTTPTGHTYTSRPPPILVDRTIAVPRQDVRTPIDIYWTPSKDHCAA